MEQILYSHSRMQDLRDLALVKKQRGPNILVCGANQSGKSSTCKTLINYALKHGSNPIFVDLDTDNNDLVPPGCIGACMIRENFASNPMPQQDVSEETVCLFIGSTSINLNHEIYNKQINYMANLV